jgi:large subunit ribosomal protein L4
MAKVKLLNMAGEEVGSLTVSDLVFKAELNPVLVHEVVVAQQANARQGTKATLSRTEVRGHAKKPFKQKGTGNARQGSTKAPHHKGGGNAFALKPRDFSKKVNKQAKRTALVSALSAKFADKEIIFLDEYTFSEAKTRFAKEFANKLGLDRNSLVVLASSNENATRATANLPRLQLQTASNLSVLEVVKYNKLVITKDAAKIIEEAFVE